MLVFVKICLCLALVELGVLVLNRLAGVIVIRERALPDLAPRPRMVGPAPPPPPAPIGRVPASPQAPRSRVPPGRAPSGVDTGVEMDTLSMHPVGSQCGVCAHPIEDDLVVCGRCEAPHHEECWAYNEGCSTYACRSGVARPPV